MFVTGVAIVALTVPAAGCGKSEEQGGAGAALDREIREGEEELEDLGVSVPDEPAGSNYDANAIEANPGEVSRSEYGKDWPLKVSHGILRCDDEAVTFLAPDGTEYGVNGTALTQGFPEIDPIWQNSPDPYVPKVNIGPIIDLGLELCE